LAPKYLPAKNVPSLRLFASIDPCLPVGLIIRHIGTTYQNKFNGTDQHFQPLAPMVEGIL